MNGSSITSIVAEAKAANNGRLLANAMTESQVRAAEKAVARGLLKKYAIVFPGYGAVNAYSIF